MRTRFSLIVFALSALANAAAAEPPADDKAQAVAPYIGFGWRALGLAGHASHGPDFQAGVLLFEHLRIGVAGFAAPGPINPSTVRRDLEDGQTYRGKSSLNFRSDGSLIGLQLSPVFPLSRSSRVEIEIPTIIGFGAFGYYLTGDDRRTPDGSRVSEVEDALLDGRDSSTGLGLDTGIRVSVAVIERSVRIYAGVHYSTVFGYDALLSDNYQGFSGVLGIELRGTRGR